MRAVIFLCWWLIAGVILGLPDRAMAQEAATLAADRIEVTADARLVADGNVEVFFDGTRLSAAAIIYDAATDRLVIEGPIYIRASDGTIFTADRASIDPKLENGLLLGARLILAEQLQLAANQIDRIDGRYTQLSRVAVTSCYVCGTRPALWEIRASRVVHDQAEQQLYFENATFRIRGVPVLWLPRMRLPDPTLTRATGLLIPQVRSTGQLGLGIKIPYFIRLADDRDLTLTPYLSSETLTLEGRYRQAFLAGDLEVRGAVTRDTLVPDTTRGYLIASGSFDVGANSKLSFGLEIASDASYLSQYDIASASQLVSFLRYSRIDDDEYFYAETAIYDAVRNDVATAALPLLVTEISYNRLFYPAGIGGRVLVSSSFDSAYRTANTPGDDGRDVARLGASAAWDRDWVFGPGMIAQARAGVNFDYYGVWQDPAYDTGRLRTTPSAGVTLRWPWAAVGPGGVRQVLEPVVALDWIGSDGQSVPNEDSLRPVFDEGNLFALTRMPGQDVVEAGGRLTAGLTWSRFGPDGGIARLGFGRIWRDTDPGAAQSTGLGGTESDWIVSAQVDLPAGLSFDGRTLLDNNLSPVFSEARVLVSSARLDLSTAYVWVVADSAVDRPDDISELTFVADYKINDIWSIGATGRYDLAEMIPARSGLTLGWQNECVTVELSASRRYTTSSTLSASTDFGLQIGLNGFSAGRSGAVPRRTCGN